MAKLGQAYAFFDSRASKEEIEKAIPSIRRALYLPPLVDLSLTEGLPSLKGGKLNEIAKKAESKGCKYVFELVCPGAANDMAAEQLVTILSEAYQQNLFKKDERFTGNVVYKEGKGYSFRI